jgi:hypothetical protein
LHGSHFLCAGLTPRNDTINRNSMILKNNLIAMLFMVSLSIAGAIPLNGHGADSEPTSKPYFTDIIVTTSDTHLLFFGELKNSLTNEMIEGLHSGIPISFSFFVELEQIKQNWLNEKLTDIEFSHTLRYDTLKQHYTVETEEISKKTHTVSTLDEAKMLLNEINGLKIVPLQQLQPDQTYRLSVQADLYKKTLPLKLHSVIPFLSWWDLKTDWYSIEFIY